MLYKCLVVEIINNNIKIDVIIHLTRIVLSLLKKVFRGFFLYHKHEKDHKNLNETGQISNSNGNSINHIICNYLAHIAVDSVINNTPDKLYVGETKCLLWEELFNLDRVQKKRVKISPSKS